MLVRKLGPDDVAFYRPLRLRALREHPQAFTSSFEEEQAKPLSAAQARLGAAPDLQFWGAFSDATGAELLGMVGLEREARRKARHKAHVIGMYVVPEAAGRGLGRALLETVIRDATGAGIESLLLTVTDGNLGAQHLYRSAGFVAFGLEPAAIKVDGLAFAKQYMALQLACP